MPDTGLDYRTLREVGGDETSTRAQQAAASGLGLVTHQQQAPQVQQPPPMPPMPPGGGGMSQYPRPGGGGYADEMASANPHAYNNSLTGQLTDVNYQRQQSGMPPLTMAQFRQLMTQRQTGPNMAGYEQLRQLMMMQGRPGQP
jgi:hypothetical protein